MFESLSAQPVNQNIEINIPSVQLNENKCIFNCDIDLSLEEIPQIVITDVFIEMNRIIPAGSMACLSHFVNVNLEQFKPEELVKLKTQRQKTILSAKNIESLLESLRHKITDILETNDKFFDELSEDELRETTGVSKVCFTQMESLLKLNLKRKDSFALGLYLTQLRSDATDRSLGIRFNIPYQTVNKYTTNVRDQLALSFVPLWLGLDSQGLRNRIKTNTSFMANALFKIPDNNIITVWDATYIYCEKSADYTFQKESFSGHKGRNLVKPMVGCSTNGFIIEATEPKKAHQSDSTILNELFETPMFRHFFITGDHFLLDKGFLNSQPVLEKEGMVVKVPLSAPFGSKSKHLSWDLANESRLVTKSRWVIELCFGSIKNRFKKFTHVWPTVSLKHLGKDFRIACAIHNMDTQRYESDQIDQISILDQIEKTKKKPNL